MIEEWKIKKLGEIFEIKPPKKEAKDKVTDTDFVTFLPMEDLGILNKDVEGTKERQLGEVSGSYTYFADNDLLLAKITPCFENGKIGIARNLVNGIGFGSSEYIVFRSKGSVIQEYLYYFLSRETFREEGKMQMTGAVGHKRVSKDFIENYPIPFPKSILEQQRIVAILDEAFAAIDKAKANAERNLKNARELFESYLDSIFKGDIQGWNRGSLQELVDESCTLSYGIVQPGDEYNDGLPIIRPTDLTTRFIRLDGLKRIDPKFADGYRRTKLVGDELLLCVRGSTGVISIATKELEGANVTRGIVPIRFDEDKINQEFGYFLLVSNYFQKQVKAKTYGTALMQINIGDLRKLQITYPSLSKQHEVVNKLNALSVRTNKLLAICERKIENLKELRKSLLQKAFSGELTAKRPNAKVVKLPIKYTTISPIDLQAGIVAFALQRHIEASKANTFKHVKAEKIVHLAEQILNIDLERNPVKDAAGPNDFPHAIKVEFRAEKVGYFNVRKTEIGYEYTPGNQLQSIISKTQAVLEAKVDKLKWLVDLLIPMTTQQAEIIATVYAAWNNLLLKGQDITDEAIVTEAREDWHPDKLKIEREKFFNAIIWMKEVGLVPTGNGKQVLAKAAK